MQKTISLIVSCLLLCGFIYFVHNRHNTNSNNNNSENRYHIEVVDYRLGKDYGKNDVLIVKYKFMHTYDKAKAFGFLFDDKVYQNGIECQHHYLKSKEITEDYKYSEIKPNTAIEFETLYGLNDSKTPVELEIKQLYTDKIVLSQTINLKR